MPDHNKQVERLLSIYDSPSQAYWRSLELLALQKLTFDTPVLEIGCGDGQFTSMLFEEIELGIDLNPRAIERCAQLKGLYKHLKCVDARGLESEAGTFSTVFANCVMEHIPDLQTVLSACLRLLRPGGKLVMTVPLSRMNHHLALKARWYAEMRQKQLNHVNLLDESAWDGLLHTVGFEHTEFRPYLSDDACLFWDRIDAIGCARLGRYHISSLLFRVLAAVSPWRLKSKLRRYLATVIIRHTQPEVAPRSACASVVIAVKG